MSHQDTVRNVGPCRALKLAFGGRDGQVQGDGLRGLGNGGRPRGSSHRDAA